MLHCSGLIASIKANFDQRVKLAKSKMAPLSLTHTRLFYLCEDHHVLTMQVRRTQSVWGSGKPEYQTTNVDLQHDGGSRVSPRSPHPHVSRSRHKGRVTGRELLCQNGESKRLIMGCAAETEFAGVSATLCVAARRRWIYSGAFDAAKSRTNGV